VGGRVRESLSAERRKEKEKRGRGKERGGGGRGEENQETRIAVVSVGCEDLLAYLVILHMNTANSR
jgi:hypothetical protein